MDLIELNSSDNSVKRSVKNYLQEFYHKEFAKNVSVSKSKYDELLSKWTNSYQAFLKEFNLSFQNDIEKKLFDEEFILFNEDMAYGKMMDLIEEDLKFFKVN